MITLRLALRHPVLVAALSGACAASPAPSPGVPVGAASAVVGPISGMVVDLQGTPFPEQIVAVGRQRTTTDGAGHFSFVDVPATYDLMIAKPDASQVTIYQGIGRRDPRVMHVARHDRKVEHRAQIVGSLGGGAPAGTSAMVTFASPRVRSVDFPVDARWKAAGSGRGEYGPIFVHWSGADTIKVQVLALLRNQQGDALSAWFATTGVTLHAGETATVDLDPAKVPVVRRRFPRIVKEKDTHAYHDILRYHEHYEIPGLGHLFFEDPRGGYSESPVHFPKNLADLDKNVADLSTYGVRLCGEAEQSDPWLHSSTLDCGFAPDQARTMTLPAPPSFVAPASGTKATPGMKFAWAAVPRAAYRLRLELSRQEGSKTGTRIEIFTARTTATWPDLVGLGLSLPKVPVACTASLAVKGPFLSMDELVASGPEGATPREHWQSESDCQSLVIRGDGAPVEVPADDGSFCSPEFFREGM